MADTQKDGVMNDVVAARKIGISPQTLRNMRCRGEGPAYVKVTKRSVRYREADIEQYLESRRIDPEAASGGTR